MNKLSTEQLLEVYKEAIRHDLSKDFILLISEELNKQKVVSSSGL
ncbi:MAG: sporulation histidine kinase inhibitor Sda [Neobacillus sp.]